MSGLPFTLRFVHRLSIFPYRVCTELRVIRQSLDVDMIVIEAGLTVVFLWVLNHWMPQFLANMMGNMYTPYMDQMLSILPALRLEACPYGMSQCPNYGHLLTEMYVLAAPPLSHHSHRMKI
ncbi:MAG: hypothetical protein GY938_06255 [Ketobacter sp.]|nr:hypothetical protein [Ketobacter sp.]